MHPAIKILIVDDETELALSLSEYLRLEGYDTEYTTNPAQALEMIRLKKYHVIFSDIVMPQIDGVDLLRRIKSYDPLAQVIMMTGYSTMEKTMLCMEAGASDYLLKPFQSLSEVVEAVKLSEVKLNRWWKSMRDTIKVKS